MTPVRKIRSYLPRALFPTVPCSASLLGIWLPGFVFFEPRPRRRFVRFLRARDVPVEEMQDEVTCGVGIPGDTNDELMDEIEARCAQIMSFDQGLFASDLDPGEGQAAGVALNPASGDTVMPASIPVCLAGSWRS